MALVIDGIALCYYDQIRSGSGSDAYDAEVLCHAPCQARQRISIPSECIYEIVTHLQRGRLRVRWDAIRARPLRRLTDGCLGAARPIVRDDKGNAVVPG